MTLYLKQSTAIDIRVGPFVDATDAVSPEVGITLGAADQAEVLKANGAATAAMAGTFAAVTGCDGWYDYTVATGDVDTVGEVVFVVQDSSVSLPVFVRATVVEEAIYDAMYGAAAAGFDANGRVDVGEWLGTAVTAATAGVPNVNATEVAGDSGAATDLFRWMQGVSLGTAQAGAAGSITLAAGESSTTDLYKGAHILVVSGSGAKQARLCTAYDGGTKVATIVPDWSADPSGTSVYIILPFAGAGVEAWNSVATVAGAIPAFAADAAGGLIISDLGGLDADAILEDTGTAIPALIGTAQNDLDIITDSDGVILGAAGVNLIWDEAMVETSGAPAVTGTMRAGFEWMFALSRNKITQTATLTTLRNDADAADLATSVISDDATTYTRAEWST